MELSDHQLDGANVNMTVIFKEKGLAQQQYSLLSGMQVSVFW